MWGVDMGGWEAGCVGRWVIVSKCVCGSVPLYGRDMSVLTIVLGAISQECIHQSRMNPSVMNVSIRQECTVLVVCGPAGHTLYRA